MINFFRRIRNQPAGEAGKMAGQNRPLKYIRYAIGEIALVVIGILLALQINTWNEGRKQKKLLNNIYSIVHKNLNTDLENIQVTIDLYKELEIVLNQVLHTDFSQSFLDSIDDSNYADCKPCHGHIGKFASFMWQSKGFDLLKTFDESTSIGADELATDLIEFYSVDGPRMNIILDFVRSEAYDNLKFYEKQNWYVDYMEEKYHPESVRFFTQNQIYKNKAATYKNIAVGNYLPQLIAYKEKAAGFINLIEERQKSHQ